MSERAYDIVLFGATSWSGQLVADYLADTHAPLRWALAGRNRDKLARLRAKLVGPHASPGLSVVDLNQPEALGGLLRSTRVAISTLGPDSQLTDALLAGCVEQSTDYVDLSGEPEALRRSAERHHAPAELNQVRIVQACGFDSLPHDLGAYFTVKALRRRMTLGEQDMLPVVVRGIVQASAASAGWNGVLRMLGQLGRSAVRALPLTAASRRGSSLRRRLEYWRPLGLWVLPLRGAPAQVVRQSADALDVYGPEFSYADYLGLRHFVHVLALLAGAGTVLGLSQTELTRRLLRKLEGRRHERDAAAGARDWFRVLFEAEAGGHRLRAVVRGGDRRYDQSAKMLAEAGLCLAFDRAHLPRRYGVLTAATAMGDALLERLQRAGIVFEELPAPPL